MLKSCVDSLYAAERGFKKSVIGKNLLLSAVFVLFAAALSGCSTYYGYDDAYGEVKTPDKRYEENVRHFVTFNVNDDSVKLVCFRKFDLCNSEIVERKIIGKNEYVKDFDSDYYLDDPLMNPLGEWEFLTGEFYDESLLKKCDNNPLCYLIPGVGQFGLCYDAIGFMGAMAIDGCASAICVCWSAIAWPSVWLGGRLFGWLGDWKLAEHKPNALLMTSYMPFINLFFPFQTPPYMTERPFSPKEIRGKEYEKLLERTKIISRKEQQEKHTSARITVEISGDGKSFGSREFATSAADGEVAIGEFFRDAVNRAPLRCKNFIFTVKLYSKEDKKLLLTRRYEIDSTRTMPLAAKEDHVSYLADDTDYLNKILLRRRSHVAWRQELLDETFSQLQNDFALQPR